MDPARESTPIKDVLDDCSPSVPVMRRPGGADVLCTTIRDVFLQLCRCSTARGQFARGRQGGVMVTTNRFACT